jgi:hypothetical protein
MNKIQLISIYSFKHVNAIEIEREGESDKTLWKRFNEKEREKKNGILLFSRTYLFTYYIVTSSLKAHTVQKVEQQKEKHIHVSFCSFVRSFVFNVLFIDFFDSSYLHA